MPVPKSLNPLITGISRAASVQSSASQTATTDYGEDVTLCQDYLAEEAAHEVAHEDFEGDSSDDNDGSESESPKPEDVLPPLTQYAGDDMWDEWEPDGTSDGSTQETTQTTPLSTEELGGKTLLDISDHVPTVQSSKSVAEEHAGLEPPPGLSAASKRKREEDEVGDSPKSPTKAAKHNLHSSPGFTSSESPIIIAHDDHVVARCKALDIRFGAQWEMARLSAKGKLSCEDLTEDVLREFAGPNATAAPKVLRKVLKTHDDSDKFGNAYAQEQAAKDPWHDLDIEQSASLEARLGICPKHPGYYGGTIHFSAKLRLHNKGFGWELEPPERSSSDRMRRRWMSESIITVKFEGWRSPEQSLEFFKRPLVNYGLVYRALRRKPRENAVYYVQTNEIFRDGAIHIDPASRMPSYNALLERLNPTALNSDQPDAKYASRFDLLFSDSVPLFCILKECNINSLEDIYATEWDGISKAKAEQVLTDGCGLANHALLRLAEPYNRSGGCPTAIQMRFRGAKGMLALHPDPVENTNPEPRIWLRPSQLKIQYSDKLAREPENCIVDLLRCSHLRDHCRIGPQVMINLAHNAAPNTMMDIFKRYINTDFSGIQKVYTTVEGPEDLLSLRDHIASKHGVMVERKTRESKGEARARGFIFDHKRNSVDNGDELDSTDSESSGSTAWWRDYISGLPSTLAETVIEALDSGFSPADCPVLNSKLLAVAKTEINFHWNPPKFYFKIRESCFGILIPDPSGSLEEGEIFVQSSRPLHCTQDGVEYTSVVLEGEVLVARSPCMLPSDVQKVRAVNRPKLSRYYDVIIFSTKNSKRSLASLLSGGDYDGDHALVIYQEDMVNNFTNSELKFADEPADLNRMFEPTVTAVADLLSRHSDLRTQLQPALLGGRYEPNLVGIYSKFHNSASYMHGYGSDEAWRLAYMFCKILDGSKSGLLVAPEIKTKDNKMYGHLVPRWTAEKSKVGAVVSKQYQSNCVVLNKPSNGPGAFIMDQVRDHMKTQRDTVTAAIERFFRKQSETANQDSVLMAPYLAARDSAMERLEYEPSHLHTQDELTAVEHYVDMCISAYAKAVRPGKFTTLPIEKRQDILRSLSHRFHVSSFMEWLEAGNAENGVRKIIWLSREHLPHIMASYLYTKSSKFSRMPWDMAFSILRALKAASCGGGGAVAISMFNYEKMTIHKVYRKPPS